MASLPTLPLMDASRDSRIHDWIAEQYSFALSEFQDDHTWRDDPPSLRESKLLPDNFDLIARSPPPSHSDTASDNDRDTLSALFYDPPLLPSPLPSLTRPPSHQQPPEDHTDLEDASNSRNKVCLIFSFSLLGCDASCIGASGHSLSASDTLLRGLPFPTAHRPIIAVFFDLSHHPDLFFPTPSSAFEAPGLFPLHL